jgi:uncharacterized protein with HEPN domain
MPPTLADRVWHILEAIKDIETALANTTRERFTDDRMLRAAMERMLEIIAEATRHIPAEVKAAETSITGEVSSTSEIYFGMPIIRSTPT